MGPRDSDQRQRVTRRRPPAAGPAEPVLAAGTEVDHFKILRLLGRGGMGEVYLARDTRLGRKVALKLVHAGLMDSAEALQQFTVEARTTARFSHPHIVTIHHVGDHQGRPYLALEYLQGQDLRARAAQQPPGTRETMRVGLAVARALAEAHSHGVLHRDLKPENVVVGDDGAVRVVDFGLARRLETEAKDGAPNADAGQAAQTLLGTPAYMAPEQWQGLEHSGATDIWALGVMLFELATGRRPFEARAPVKLAMQICRSTPAPRADKLAELPAELADLIAHCLSKQPDQRPTAEQLVQRLERLLHPALQTGKARPASPFRGLLPFDEQHAAFFFGREAEISAFVERLRAEPVLSLVGTTGAGKSSFLQAGVVPRLREQEPWLVLRLRPGSDPLEALASRLIRLESHLPEAVRPKPEARDARGLVRQLRDTPRALGLLLRELAETRQTRVLLLVDQLEELITLGSRPKVRRQFLEAVCTAADDAEDPTRVVLAMRDDYLGRLAASPRVRAALRQVTVLQNPGAEALEQILRRPVEAAGYQYEDPEMVGQMVASVRGEAAGLPLLQSCARLLWDNRDEAQKRLLRSAYEQMGGVEGALARHADGVLHGLGDGESRLARQLLLRLVTAEHTRQVIATPYALEGLGEGGENVLARLVDARLVAVTRAPGGDGAEAMLELAHESLIHSWGTLSRWLDEGREDLAFLQEVEQAARLWQRRGQRPAELWQGDALVEARRKLKRCTAPAPQLVLQFLNAARQSHQRRLWRRRGLALAVVAVLGVVILVLALQKSQLAQQKQVAEERRAEALRQRGEAQRRRAEALLEGARAALGKGALLEARAKLRSGLQLADSSLARILWRRLAAEPLVWRRQFGDMLFSVAFAPSGRSLAVACQDRAVYLLDVKTLRMRVLRGHRDQVYSVAFAPRGKILASGSWSGQILLWDASTGRLIKTLVGHKTMVRGLSFSPDGELLASASHDNSVRIWEVKTGKQRRRLEGHTGSVWGVRFAPDGKRLASSSVDHSVRIWEVKTGKAERILRGHTDTVISLDFSSDGTTLATASVDSTVRLWEVNTGRLQKTLRGHSSWVYGVRFSPDGRWLASGGTGRKVRIWDLKTGAAARTLEGHTSAIWGLAFSPDSRLLASASSDRSVRLWDLHAGAQYKPPAPSPRAIYGVAFSPDNKLLAAAMHNKTVTLWSVATGEVQRELRGHLSAVWGLDFAPDGRLLASASGDRNVRLWQVHTGNPGHVLRGHTSQVNGVSFSPDGTLLASGSVDRSVRLWQVHTGKQLRRLQGHTAAVWGVDFSPDGRLLASAGGDHNVRLWEVRSGRPLRVLRGHSAWVFSVSFSPDGRTLLSGALDGSMRLWDVASGAQKKVFRPGASRVYAALFHPDGRRAGSTSSDGAARVWTLDGSRKTEPLRGHAGEVNWMAFSGDGRLAASSSDDGTVRLWELARMRPLWRAPLLLGSPPLLYSHRGWRALDGSGASKPRRRWQAAVAQRALATSPAPGSRLLCIRTAGSELELWDLAADRRLRRVKLAGLQRVLALGRSCLAQTHSPSADQVWLVGEHRRQQLKLSGRVTALGRGGATALVATRRAVQMFAADGTPAGRREVAAGVTALTRVDPGGLLVVGFADGNLELLPANPAQARATHSFEQVPASPVRRILAGPMRTLAVGYANGLVGLWQMSDGKRLMHGQLHGPVEHLLIEQGKLHAATGLGQHLSWDLGVFHDQRCKLLRQIWQKVPVVWERGVPVEREPPVDHACKTGGSKNGGK